MIWALIMVEIYYLCVFSFSDLNRTESSLNLVSDSWGFSTFGFMFVS